MLLESIATLSIFLALAIPTPAPYNDAIVVQPPPGVQTDVRFFAGPITALEIDGALPESAQRSWSLHNRWRARNAAEPRVVMTDGAEAYLFVGDAPNNEISIAARIPVSHPATGWLEFPDQDRDSAVIRRSFRIPSRSPSDSDRAQFFTAARGHYRFLLELGAPGAAWFRMRMLEADGHLDEPAGDDSVRDPVRVIRNRSGDAELEEMMGLFAGSRAIAENLQLDRAMLFRDGDPDKTLSIDSLTGIETREMDWSAYLSGVSPAQDSLATVLPADQYALFFPSFVAMVAVIDELDRAGTPLLDLFEEQSVDAGTRARYEQQLTLQLDALSRQLGPKVIRAIAVTGSDPYLRSGSDIAVLFDTKEPSPLLALLAMRHSQARADDPTIQDVEGSFGDVSFRGIRNKTRSVHSLVAVHGNTVLVTNSEVQIRALAEVAAGDRARLADIDEYAFFRQRYPLPTDTDLDGNASTAAAGESAFLILSDAAIRAWCGPRSRIGASRRIRAQALMAHHRVVDAAREAGMQIKQDVPPVPQGYGELTFLTPIAELDLDLITDSEADAYRRFKNTYQQNWDAFFDPIAVSMRVSDQEVSADITVMPLIENTDFREMIELSKGARLRPASGDPHEGTVLHWAMALNKDSKPIRELGNFFNEFGLKMNALSWLGDHVSVFIDEDPFLSELAALPLEQMEERAIKDMFRLPVAFLVDVDDGFGVAAFLTAARAFAQQSAPGMLAFESVAHGEQAYVKIRVLGSPFTGRRYAEQNEDEGSAEDEEGPSICYAVTPDRLVFTPNEPLLRRWLDRRALQDPVAATPWAGESVAVTLHPDALSLLGALCGSPMELERRNASYLNLYILNEWQRIFPNQDPAEVHARVLEQRLHCPGGGRYPYNADLLTVESSAYGCPAAPRLDPLRPTIFQLFRAVDAGVTFEKDGLRARARATR